MKRALHDVVEPGIATSFAGRGLEDAAWQFAGEHFIKQDTEAVEVGAVVHMRSIAGLLGRGVGGVYP